MIGSPPLSTGAAHYIVIEVKVEVSLVGVPGTPGRVAAIAENTLDGKLSPTIFLAITLN